LGHGVKLDPDGTEEQQAKAPQQTSGSDCGSVSLATQTVPEMEPVAQAGHPGVLLAILRLAVARALGIPTL
jgi:hypothetical protein